MGLSPSPKAVLKLLLAISSFSGLSPLARLTAPFRFPPRCGRVREGFCRSGLRPRNRFAKTLHVEFWIATGVGDALYMFSLLCC
jgi:hypothetical protein